MSSPEKSSSFDYFLNFSFEQSNLLDIQKFLNNTKAHKYATIFVILDAPNVLEVLKQNKVKRNAICHGILNIEYIEYITYVHTIYVCGTRQSYLQLCKEGKEVHLLELKKQSCFKWLEASAGANVTFLNKYTVNNHSTYEFNQLKSSYDRPVTIIFAEYGMGKTTCLNLIKEYLITHNENIDILYLDASKLLEFCHNFTFVNTANFVEYFNVDLTTRTMQVHIMYDNVELIKGYDIIGIMLDIHLNYRHVKQWITCSEIACRNKLESNLGTFANVLAPVSKNRQRAYLRMSWNIGNNDSDEYINSILRQCNKWYWQDNRSSVNGNFKDSYGFCSYPLHLKIISNYFKYSNKLEIGDVNILDLYEHFVSTKYDNNNIQELAVIKLFDYFNIDHTLTGNDEPVDFTFESVSVINYLAAKWFSKYFRRYQEEFKLLLRGSSSTWSFQYFFNSFLSRGKVLHTAVLNRWSVRHVQTGLMKGRNERDSGGRTALHLASERYIMSVLLEVCEVDVRDDVLQWTPLQYCDYLGKLECLNLLLEHNADVNQLTRSLNLSKAAISRRLEYAFTSSPKLEHYINFICEKCTQFPDVAKSVGKTDYKLSPNIRMMVLTYANDRAKYLSMHEGKTPLFYAVDCNNFDAVKYLVNFLGFDINHRCQRQRSPFHMACFKGNIEIAEYFLDLGYNVNNSDLHNTPFSICCRNDDVKFLIFLVRRGIDLNFPLKDDSSPVNLAYEYGSKEILKYLIENIDTLNLENVNIYELMSEAVFHEDEELLDFLFSQKQTFYNNKVNGKTILHNACQSVMDDTITVRLLKVGADVNAVDDHGSTPVFYLCYAFETLKQFAKYGSNLLHVNKYGETVLHMYCKKDLSNKQSAYLPSLYAELIDMIKYLIIYGVDINSRTVSGETPLHYACLNNHLPVVQCLVTEGANINVLNNKGESPLHLACIQECDEENNFKICKYLVSKGLNVNQRTKIGKTPLMYAVNCPRNIEPLIFMGADMFSRDDNNKTVVHYFTERGLLGKLELLAKLGMKDARTVDLFGQTALDIATEEDYLNCFKYLVENFDTEYNIDVNNQKLCEDLINNIKKELIK